MGLFDRAKKENNDAQVLLERHERKELGDMTLSNQDVLWLDPNDTEDRNFNFLGR